jgi:hypothetical protein
MQAFSLFFAFFPRTREPRCDSARRGSSDLSRRTLSRGTREQMIEMRPIEMWARIGLATRRDFVMTYDAFDRKRMLDCGYQARQYFVLRWREGLVVAALKLYPYREIIAALGSSPLGRTGVPGTQCAGDELGRRAVASNEKMRRYALRVDFAVVRMSCRIQPVGKQALDSISTELTWRQTDRMNDDQAHEDPVRPLVTIRRRNPARTGQPRIRIKPVGKTLARTDGHAGIWKSHASRKNRARNRVRDRDCSAGIAARENAPLPFIDVSPSPASVTRIIR